MGDFDDVLAMRASDDWDLPLGDGMDELQPPSELREVLRLPGALVELRGEVPDEALERLAPLTDPRLVSDDQTVVSLVVTRDDGRWCVDRPAGRRDVEGARADDLVAELLAALDELVLGSDPGRLHLAASCVEIDGVGVLVVSAQPEDRVAVTEELVRRGAIVLTQRIVTVQPGSHTVFAYPAPPHAFGAAGRPPMTPYTTIDVVVHVEAGGPAGSGPQAPSALTPLATSESCMRLLGVAVDRDRFGGAALDVLATTASNAAHWEVFGNPGSAAAAIRAAPPPPRRSFCVLHRFDDVAGSASSSSAGEPASLRVAKFEDGVLALDVATGTSLALRDDEIEALEELLVERPGSRRSSGTDPRLSRLAAHGVYVPDERVRRPVPGPEAYGLPNCPSGPTARTMWTAGRQDPAELVSDPDTTDGSTALAVLRGVLPGDDDQHRTAIQAHLRVQEAVVDVERELLSTLTLLEVAGIDPIVLGSVVHAHDGPLPPYFAESEEIDLLVHDGELERAVATLAEAGYSRSDMPVSGDGEGHGVVDLTPSGGAGAHVRLRDTLAVGPFGALVDHEEFHRRAVPIRVHGRWCRSLHPEHRFVHACMRVELDDDDPSTQHVRDVVLAAPRADALMAEAMEASERWGATATVTAAVRLVDDLLPGLSPWIVQRATRRDAMPQDERRRGGRRSRRAVRRR